MSVSTAFLREFVRKVFRDARGCGASPDDILDRLSDAAMEAANATAGSGKIATGITTPEGNSYSWRALSVQNGYERQAELIDQARAVIAGETETSDTARDAALAKIVTVRGHRTSLQNVYFG